MKIKSIMLVLAVAASSVRAEEESAPVVAPAAKVVTKVSFSTLPLCSLCEGQAEVRTPGGEWTAVAEGKFYPLGASFRTGKVGRLVISLGPDSSVTLASDSSMGMRAQALGVASRTIVLASGTVELDLAENLPEGAVLVTAPGFTVKNPAGRSRYVYEDCGDGDRVAVRCVTGTLGLDGRHFSIPSMHPADEVVIRTSHDHLATFISCTSGDYLVRLDQGDRSKDEIGDDGLVKKVVEKSTVDWRLSPKMKISISRMVPSVGERMSVYTMVFNAAGEPQGRGVSFSEGRPEVNFGEIGVKEKVDGDELAKRAAEATETTEAADDEESSDQKKSEKNDSEKTEDNN